MLTFSASTYAVGAGPQVIVADVNGDGRLDLITANENTNNLTVLTNDGNGGFKFYTTLVTAGYPGSAIAADFNRNGRMDLICNTTLGLEVLTNDGHGVFGPSVTLAVGSSPQAPVAADINSDGYLDLIVPSYTSSGTLTLFTNNTHGTFGYHATYSVGSYPACVCAADVNGDGYVDLITASYRGNNGNSLTVLTNNGKGVFGFNARIAVGKAPIWIAAVDVNGDGYVDLLTANNEAETLTVLTNNGTGVFGINATLTVGGTPVWVSAADLSGNGRLDLITANGGTWTTVPGNGRSLTVLTNNGNGVFGSNVTFSVGNGVLNVVAADVNADGKQDLITANFYDNSVTVLVNATSFPTAANFPQLTVKQQGNNMRVSWPSASPGWSLQENVSLERPSWLPSGYDGWPVADEGGTYPIADDGTTKSLTFPCSRGSLFFRLLHP